MSGLNSQTDRQTDLTYNLILKTKHQIIIKKKQIKTHTAVPPTPFSVSFFLFKQKELKTILMFIFVWWWQYFLAFSSFTNKDFEHLQKIIEVTKN